MQYSLPLGSKTIAKIMHLHNTEDLDEGSILESAKNGIYIGNVPKFGLPVFLNFESSINNHMFVAGMTGSGKSYFLKNLILKMNLIYNYSISILDFTGEYGEFAKFLLQNGASKGNKPDCAEAVTYLDLSALKENEKAEIAERQLNLILDSAVKGHPQFKRFVVLDEAWKLLSRESILRKLIREGRKYGIGILMASQMLEDIDRVVIENVATVVVFRLQNIRSLRNLERNYNLPPGIINAVQNLEVGSCLIIRLGKNSKRNVLFVERVIGSEFPKLMKIHASGSMDLQIDERKFALFLNGLNISKEAESEIVRIASDNGISLSDLITKLMRAGGDKRKILYGLRMLGVGESEIADAFSYAIAKMGREQHA